MKYCFALLVLLLVAPIYAQTRIHAITLVNDKPCQYVTQVRVLDIAADGTVDVIQYRTSTAGTAVYVYHGPGLYELWKSDPSMMPPGTTLAERATPVSSEYGIVAPDGDRMQLTPINKPAIDLIRAFKGADELIRANKDDMLSDANKRTYQSWIADRFAKDVLPDPRTVCADPCKCPDQPAAIVDRSKPG